MTDKDFRKFIKNARRAYQGTAVLKIESGNLVLRNVATNCLHPFVDDREKIPLTSEQKRIVNQILNE